MTVPRCRHVCACGAVLVCGEPDKCAAGKHWQCPTCEQAAEDAYWQGYYEQIVRREQRDMDREKHTA